MVGALFKYLSFRSNPESETHTRVNDALPVLRAKELLHDYRDLLQSIRRIVGVPKAHWSTLYEPLLKSYAEFVQQLPASEAHHHAGPGGMLAHGLESVNEALKLRRGQLLPHGATAEDLAKYQDLWTYAVATGALLHDLGKPVSDQKILMLDHRGRSMGYWNPWDGAMPDSARYYRIEFLRDRKYRLHDRLPPLLARFILPQQGLSWLSSNLDVFDAWLAAISGDPENAGALGELIQQADAISVSVNLAGTQAQMPGARQKPLSTRMLTGLRFLLDSQSLPLNRRGAAGWLVEDDLWLVSKRVLDALREHLEHEGHGGIPRRNDRLMDELQQNGLLIPSPEERAIWNAIVTLGDWRQQLTLLRIPAHVLWPNTETRPEPCDGTITPITEDDTSTEQPTATKETGTTTQVRLSAPAWVENNGDNASTSSLSSAEEPSVSSKTASEPLGSETAGKDRESETFDFDGISLPLPPGIEISEEDMNAGRGAVSGDTGAVAGDERAHPASEEQDAGLAFVQWLKDGLASGRMLINTVNARIHVVPEGLLLVSPGIFKDFNKEKWSHAQKRFLKLKVHQKNPDGTNIWTYQAEGNKKRSKLKGIRIGEPEKLLGFELPEPNPHLSLHTPAVKAEDKSNGQDCI